MQTAIRRRAFAAALTVTAGLLTLGCETTQTTGSAAGPGLAAPGALDTALAITPGDVVELEVWGMSCPKCITNVDVLVKRHPGVVDVSTDMQHGLVTVRTQLPAPTVADLKTAIDEAGFTLVGAKIAETTR